MPYSLILYYNKIFYVTLYHLFHFGIITDRKPSSSHLDIRPFVRSTLGNRLRSSARDQSSAGRFPASRL